MQMSRWWVAVLTLALLGTGCATKKYVHETVNGEVGAVHTRVDSIEGQVESVQAQIQAHDEKLAEQGRDIGEASRTAQDALDRAMEAGKLARGKLLYETVLSDDKVRFGFDQSRLSPEAEAALDDFAAGITAENRNVYIEIQGHTDSVGDEGYNERLGLARAEAVRRYLNQTHHIPLHRMSVISYGESAPIADNGTREGRALNRRVALVVLE